MLSVTATNVLAVVDPAILKNPPSTIPTCSTLTYPTIASSWTDNSNLYLASQHAINRYDALSNQLTEIYTQNDGLFRSMVAKDKASVVVCVGDKIHLLECSGSTAKISQTFNSHKAEVLSLSLSNDSTLLASATAKNIHIYNLALGSHTSLRGLPASDPISVCAFHPHTRTRLLVGAGDQLLVYDTTRASSPLKSITIGERATGRIIAIACSPFSKTLVVVATGGGFIGLVDLDKERGLFRILDLNVPLTALGFSPEGAAIYTGTENGKLLIIDLRALDKPPKSVVISESGNRIDTVSVQKKIKNVEDKSKVTASITKPTPSPLRSRPSRATTVSTPARKTSITVKTATPKTVPANPRQALSPKRDPLGNSLSTKATSSSAAKVSNPTPVKSSGSRTRIRRSSTQNSHPPEASQRTGTTSSLRSLKSTTGLADSSVATPSVFDVEPVSSVLNAKPSVRTRATSSASVPPSDYSTATVRQTRAGSSSSGSSVASRRKHIVSSPPVPPVPALPTETVHKPLPVESRASSRTPSPNLPAINGDPTTPLPSQRRKAMTVLGLGTPEVKAWIKAGAPQSIGDRRTTIDIKGKGKAKSVGFKDDQSDGDSPQDEDNDQGDGRELSVSMQISPHRSSLPTSSSYQTNATSDPQSWEASPLRPRHASAQNPGASSAGSAHELLKTIVQDAMYDFQREQRAEMMGMHLDLVKMGRGWKEELRSLMEEYVGDLNDLREENKRLREENERLRRGY